MCMRHRNLVLGKELAFVTTKFLIFDSLREALLFFVPAFVEAQPLLIACLCGALAGACGAITSHPIDTLFALRTTGGGKEIPSLDKLFRGLVDDQYISDTSRGQSAHLFTWHCIDLFSVRCCQNVFGSWWQRLDANLGLAAAITRRSACDDM
eukprot:s504_g1.t1